MASGLDPSGATLAMAFDRRMRDIVDAQVQGGREALGIAGAMITAEVKRIISQPYPPASVPGEPPHRRRGENGGLLSSYGWALEGENTVLVGSGGADPPLLPVYLEMGTRNMEARPHLRPAVANLLQGGGGQLQEVFARHVAAAIRRAAA